MEIKNDPEVFREIFSAYYKPIFGYVFRRTGSFDDAADIASDTFLKAFNAIPKYVDRGIPVKVWLYRIATNEVNLYFRGRKKYHHLFKDSAMENPDLFRSFLQEDREVLEVELTKHQQFLSVLAQLKMLPVKYQQVIALRYFEGKDNTEIAQILDIKDGTIKSLLSRGVEKLRNLCK